MYKVMTFSCKGQYITPPREEPVADSVKYLQAKFVFAESELVGTVTAIFKSYAGVKYTLPLDAEYSCEIPAEVIKAPGFYVSCYGTTDVTGSTKTYESILIKLKPSGYGIGITPRDPDETTYAAILAMMDGKTDYINTMPEAAVGYLEKTYIYTGEDTAEYTQGNIYKCALDGDIYSWVNMITLDTAPADGSGKPITSGAVYTALTGKSAATHNHDERYSPISHITDTENPHSVTKSQVGLGNSDNTADIDKPISTAQAAALDGKSSILHDHDSEYAPIGHISNTDNPHGVTKAQVGLGNADNTSDEDKPISAAQKIINDAKADKVTAPTAGNFAVLTEAGDLEDSGLKPEDFATPEKQFEEIEVITIAEDVEAISRSIEQNNTPYNFSEMEIQFNFPVCTPIKITVHFASIAVYYPVVTGNFGSASYQTFYRVYFKNNGGLPFGYTSYHTNSVCNAGSIIAIASIAGQPSAMGKALHINTTSGNFIPAGTIITIKGKRK